jgi:two-component system chemotaxis response regulator CheV
MGQEQRSNILMDARSSELEIVEFAIKDTVYGINIAKVREIINADIDLVPTPDAHPSIYGVINLRGAILPVVNLAVHLKVNVDPNPHTNRIIIAEFNKIIVGFLVSSVARIHHISWKSVEVPSDMMTTTERYTAGIVKIDKKVIFLLDFEKIAYHINPNAHIREAKAGQYNNASFDRSTKKILIVDDSDLSRRLICDHLKQAGYQIDTAIHGEDAWSKLSSLLKQPDFERIETAYNLMITDIEMPQLDGLHLIKRVKEDPRLKRLPCIAFSSIISKEMIQQCQNAGADGEISKPEIGELVDLVDAKIL